MWRQQMASMKDPMWIAVDVDGDYSLCLFSYSIFDLFWDHIPAGGINVHKTGVAPT